MTELLTHYPTSEAAEGKTEAEQCSVQDVVKILIGSFRFSQGDNLLQKSLLAQVSFNNRGRIAPDIVDQAVPVAIEAASKIIGNSKLHFATGTASSQVLEFSDYLKNNLSTAPPDLSLVARAIISRDYKFLVIRAGRSRSQAERITPANDPYLSHFVHYVLLRNSTGIPEYDQVFSQISDEYRQNKEEIIAKCDENLSYVERMVELYIQHHPEQAEPIKAAFRS